jgi:REP element-mobilizing transposase RayT
MADKLDETIRRRKRGYLPHYDSAKLTQFITFRLADSLPATFLKSLRYKLHTKEITEIEYHWRVEKTLDLGRGPIYLADPKIARIVSDAIVRFDGERLELIAWVVMPNHVHLLLRVIAGFELSIMHSIKSYTASRANKILKRSGRFWSPDYFDRFIRDHAHFINAKKYIEENPVKAGLCPSPAEWPWGSPGWRG